MCPIAFLLTTPQEGLITVAVALGAFFILPDYPATTRWLSAEEKRLASARLLSVQLEDADAEHDHMGHWEAFKLACKDFKTWVFALCYNLLNMVGTISYFFPTLMVRFTRSVYHMETAC